MKQVASSDSSFNMKLLHAAFLLGLLFDPDDGDDMFFRNIG
jgi:hypothetical protein